MPFRIAEPAGMQGNFGKHDDCELPADCLGFDRIRAVVRRLADRA